MRARAHLKHVAVLIVIVGDHVRNIDPATRVLDRSCDLPSASADRQRSLDHLLAEVTGPQAIGRKFLAGQMDQPNIALQFAGLAELQERSAPSIRAAVAE